MGGFEAVDVAVVLIAAVVAGIMNAVVGAGTIVTFPILVLVGLDPVTAIVANTIGILPASFAGAYGYRETLRGRGPLTLRLSSMSLVGGLVGAILLVRLPPGVVARVVPPLLLLAGLLAALQPRIGAAIELHRAARPADRGADGDRITVPLLLAVGATGVYGGYFGAAQGVLLLVTLGAFLGGSMNDLNGIKNVLSAVANMISALFFILSDTSIAWVPVALVAIGSFVGGTLGGVYGRRLSGDALRIVIIVIAVVAAARQWLIA